MIVQNVFELLTEAGPAGKSDVCYGILNCPPHCSAQGGWAEGGLSGCGLVTPFSLQSLQHEETPETNLRRFATD